MHFLMEVSNKGIYGTNTRLYKHGIEVLYIFVYVDGIIIMWTNLIMVSQFILIMSLEFCLRDLGDLHYFLGIEVIKKDNGILHHNTNIFKICWPKLRWMVLS